MADSTHDTNTGSSEELKGTIRSPICVVAGHVDHGKSSILDSIRGTSIVAGEPGAITQSIGASLIPVDRIKKLCWSLINQFNFKMNIPGILFIDTPGHAAFTNLRKRGGSIADIAILVVDLNEGFKPQTIEALEILKSSRTPFVVAANKLDLLPGWRSMDGMLLANVSRQPESIQYELDKKIYELVGRLSEFGFNSERFDRVTDHTKQVLIVPCSAKTGEGIPELLLALTGLTQRYLEKAISCTIDSPGKGTILEVKEVKGVGTVLDTVLYDGSISVNDSLVVGAIPDPIITKVRAIFEPSPLNEIRDKKAAFRSVKRSFAASAIRIVAPELDSAIGGMPVRAIPSALAETPDFERVVADVVSQVRSEIEEVLIETDKEGIIVKADSIGSLEAAVHILRDKGFKIKKAGIGNISKKDVAEAASNLGKHPEYAVVVGFSVQMNSDVEAGEVKVITNDVIYRLVDELDEWQLELRKKMEEHSVSLIGRPFKIEVLQGYVFRQS
ncbi:translation initiation factor IF-2, partial [Candidatus Woesearchaeota archaeon]